MLKNLLNNLPKNSQQTSDLSLISQVSGRNLSRRSLVALGLGIFTLKLPLGLASRNREIGNDDSLDVSIDVRIDFPEGYTMENYEFDVPIWSKNEKVRDYIRSFVSSGQLIEYKKVGFDRGVKYRFIFKTAEDLKSFVVGVRDQQLVDFERRSSRGLTTKMFVSGTEVKC